MPTKFLHTRVKTFRLDSRLRGNDGVFTNLHIYWLSTEEQYTQIVGHPHLFRREWLEPLYWESSNLRGWNVVWRLGAADILAIQIIPNF
jgi:hypothetical protein